MPLLVTLAILGSMLAVNHRSETNVSKFIKLMNKQN